MGRKTRENSEPKEGFWPELTHAVSATKTRQVKNGHRSTNMWPSRRLSTVLGRNKGWPKRKTLTRVSELRQKYLLNNLCFAQPQRIARARFGRLPKPAACRKAPRRLAKVLHPSGRSKHRGGCVQLQSNCNNSCTNNFNTKDTRLEILPLSNQSVPCCCICLTWTVSSSKHRICSSALFTATCAALRIP